MKQSVPWILVIILSGTTIWGWSGWMSLKNSPDQTTHLSESVAPRVATAENAVSVANRRVDSSRERLPGNSSKQTTEGVMERRDVQAAIENRAVTLAQEIADEEIEARELEKRDEQADKLYARYDAGEVIYGDAVDSYAEASGLSAESTTALHSIIEDSFNKQREVLNSYYADEMGEDEAKREAGIIYQESKDEVNELLGEEGAQEFGSYVREAATK